MQTPTTTQFRTAIEVLKKLGMELNERSSNSVINSSDSTSGDNQTGRMQATTIEQTTRILSVAEQLEAWRKELAQPRRQCVSNHV